MTHEAEMQARLKIMQETKTIAIVGVSANPARASNSVAAYLLRTPYRLFMVNPNYDEVLGYPCYPSLADLPEVPDMVDVFRRREELPRVVDAAIAVGAKSVWFQLGLRHDEAAQKAIDAGLEVVQDRCLKIEHARFASELHSGGGRD